MVDPKELLAEAEATTFQGWDFSTLGDRLVLEPPDWDFEEIVANAVAGTTTMLDMGTGGGEWLSSLRARAPFTVATEGWQPNVAVATARLSPLGVPVVYTEGAADNHRQEPGDPAGRLPFRTEAFDLVTNRHESFRATEIARVLRRDGTFVTQQTHSGSQQFHELLGSEPPGVQELELDMIAMQLEDAGLSIDEAEVGTATTVFADIGALAWYLRSVPWAVPGFTVSTYRQALLRLHDGPIRVPHRRFWLRAHKFGAGSARDSYQ
jgi:SAM-dependent methyltransferase